MKLFFSIRVICRETFQTHLKKQGQKRPQICKIAIRRGDIDSFEILYTGYLSSIVKIKRERERRKRERERRKREKEEKQRERERERATNNK